MSIIKSKIIETLKENAESLGSKHYVRLPIYKIDDVVVEGVYFTVYIRSTKKVDIGLEIDMKSLEDNDLRTVYNEVIAKDLDIDACIADTDEELFVAVEKVKNNFPFMRFSVMNGVFRLGPIDSCEQMYEELRKIDNIKLDCDECCVCYRITRTKTRCNHPLCSACFQQIPEDEEDAVNCPVCREQIFSR